MRITNSLNGAIVVLCTAPAASDGLAERLARGLVQQGLAACVNILPQLRSVYRWRDEIQCDREQQLIIKTRQEQLPAIVAWLESNHPYEVPEVIALPICGGSENYVRWVLQESEVPKQASDQAPQPS
jgi:periplasmic divalent cation tolerance protein